MITVTAWQPLAAKLMHAFEGCVLRAYPDPGSKDGKPWTIGWGSTGPDIGSGTVWTQEHADVRFLDDLDAFGRKVAALLGDAPTTAHQMAALVSLAYNIGAGEGGLKTSTVLRKHPEGDYAGAQAAFSMWVKNDGRVMQGLVRRRKAEAELYGTPDA